MIFIAYLIAAACLATAWCLVLARPAGRRGVAAWWHRLEDGERTVRVELGSPYGVLFYASALLVIFGVLLSAGCLLDLIAANHPQ